MESIPLNYVLCADFMFWLVALFQVGSTAGVNSEAANTMMQKFWDSAMELTPDDEDETRRFVHFTINISFLICFYFLKISDDMSVRIPWRCLLKGEKPVDLFLILLPPPPVFLLSRFKMEKEGCIDFYVVSFQSDSL